MKAALPLLAVLAAATACHATTPPTRNTLPSHQALTETTMPENSEPSRLTGLALLTIPPVK